MSCPTCGHDMNLITQTEYGDEVHVCPECGTVQIRRSDLRNDDYVPKLVERCREFEDAVIYEGKVRISDEAGSYWQSTGIAEAINKPEN